MCLAPVSSITATAVALKTRRRSAEDLAFPRARRSNTRPTSRKNNKATAESK